MVFIHIYVDEYLWVQIHIELDLGIDSNIKKSGFYYYCKLPWCKHQNVERTIQILIRKIALHVITTFIKLYGYIATLLRSELFYPIPPPPPPPDAAPPISREFSWSILKHFEPRKCF